MKVEGFEPESLFGGLEEEIDAAGTAFVLGGEVGEAGLVAEVLRAGVGLDSAGRVEAGVAGPDQLLVVQAIIGVKLQFVVVGVELTVNALDLLYRPLSFGAVPTRTAAGAAGGREFGVSHVAVGNFPRPLKSFRGTGGPAQEQVGSGK